MLGIRIMNVCGSQKQFRSAYVKDRLALLRECSRDTLQVHSLYNFMTRCTNWADIMRPLLPLPAQRVPLLFPSLIQLTYDKRQSTLSLSLAVVVVVS